MARTVNFKPRPKPDYYKGSYTRQAKAITDQAKANPLTPCGRCGRTLAQHPPHRNGRPPHWQAGHIIDGLPNGPLRAEVSTCNGQAGARLGNRRARGQQPDPLNRSQQW